MPAISTASPIMKRGEALLFAVLTLAAAAFLLYLPWSGILKFLCVATALVCGSIFAIGALWPKRFLTGVVVFDGGFEIFAGLRGGQKVRFIDIEKIVAVQTGGGGQGDEVMLEICTVNRKVRLGEGDLFNTDLHNVLFNLPGFQHEQFSNAAAHQLSGLDHFRLKRFTVFERSSALINRKRSINPRLVS